MLRVRCCRPAMVRSQAALDGGVEMQRPRKKLLWACSDGYKQRDDLRTRSFTPCLYVRARNGRRIAELIRRIKRDTEKQQVLEFRVYTRY